MQPYLIRLESISGDEVTLLIVGHDLPDAEQRAKDWRDARQRFDLCLQERVIVPTDSPAVYPLGVPEDRTALRGCQKQLSKYLDTDRILYPTHPNETVSSLRQQITDLRTALDMIGDACEVYIISGDEGCRPSLGWIEKVAHESLARNTSPQGTQ